MAYNNLSGSVLLPEELLKVEGVNAGIVSGNLSTSDAATVINVPRVALPNSDSLVINTGGDANTLRCDTKLTFDGQILGLDGELSGSGTVVVGNSISSSGDLAVTGNVHATAYYGDGSNLIGVGVSGSARIYSTTGLETSGYLKVSGSAYLSGGVAYSRREVNSNHTVTVGDYYIGVDSTSNIVKVTLPAANTLINGHTIIVKDEGGESAINNITVSGSVGSGDTIDGENQVVLSSPFAAIQLYCNGANKFFIA